MGNLRHAIADGVLDFKSGLPTSPPLFPSVVHGLSAVEGSPGLKHNLRMTVTGGAARKLSRVTLSLILVIGSLATTACAKDVALISNKNNSLATMTLADLV